MKKIYLYALVASFAFGVAGCKKIDDFGNTNLSPDGVSTPIPSALLTNAQASFGAFASNGTMSLYGAQYAQYFSETQYSSVSLYATPQVAFTSYYNGPLYDLQNIIGLNVSNNMTQVAKIIQSYMFWTITDTWGDVPYSDALKGIGSVTPKYDTQEDIYKGILETLKTAVNSMDNSAISGDIIYNGNADAWKRAANSLRMLVAIQLSKKVPATNGYAAVEFKSALEDANGYIANNSQNLKITGIQNFKSNWWSLYDGRKDYGVSKTLTDLTASLGDDRANAFGGSSETPGSTGSSTVGVPYGYLREASEAFTSANPNWARVLRGDLRDVNGVVNIISAAEVALARAEAANIGWTSENVKTVYEQGIALSFEQWGVDAPDASYFAQSSVAVGAAGDADNNRKISTQRYLASYPDGHKGWNIWRKSGFPVLTPAPDAEAGKQIVQRFTYSTTEYNNNGVNVREAVARLQGGEDHQEAKVWWNQ